MINASLQMEQTCSDAPAYNICKPARLEQRAVRVLRNDGPIDPELLDPRLFKRCGEDGDSETEERRGGEVVSSPTSSPLSNDDDDESSLLPSPLFRNEDEEYLSLANSQSPFSNEVYHELPLSPSSTLLYDPLLQTYSPEDYGEDFESNPHPTGTHLWTWWCDENCDLQEEDITDSPVPPPPSQALTDPSLLSLPPPPRFSSHERDDSLDITKSPQPPNQPLPAPSQLSLPLPPPLAAAQFPTLSPSPSLSETPLNLIPPTYQPSIFGSPTKKRKNPYEDYFTARLLEISKVRPSEIREHSWGHALKVRRIAEWQRREKRERVQRSRRMWCKVARRDMVLGGGGGGLVMGRGDGNGGQGACGKGGRVMLERWAWWRVLGGGSGLKWEVKE